MAGAKGALGLIVAGVAGVAALFAGMSDANASEKHPTDPWNGEDPAKVKQADDVSGIIAAAVAKCKDVDFEGCDTNALRSAAAQIRAYPFTDASIKAKALEQATVLENMANDADKVQSAYNKEAQYLGNVYAGAMKQCSSAQNCNTGALYSAAQKLQQYPWTTQVKGEALAVAGKLQALAKDVEDAQKAQKEANYPG
jgi:hypothetical protein